MLESFGRGFKMIGASIKLGWQDKRLLLPSILTVCTNIFFGLILLLLSYDKMGTQGAAAVKKAIQPTYGMLGQHGHHISMPQVAGQLGLNGPMDPSGFNSFQGLMNTDAWLTVLALLSVWWLTNRFLEGVTTGLVYSNLTEGPGSGSFGQACSAVLSSFPAIVVLGIVTLLAKTVARWLRNHKSSGMLGFGFNFLAQIVEVFWTLAGHLILPAIVIEGTSFWGGMKRADKIAQSNLLTIGVGEVGVDGICRFVSFLVYSAGVAGFGYAYYLHLGFAHPLIITGGLAWVAMVVLVTAMSIYIRAAFYTCLYVWAIEAEAVRETERTHVSPPAPLAAALA